MQFDWTTFALEVLNFLVLLWILKRFLYQPVLGVLDARQKIIHDQAAQAEAVRKEADTMKAQYEKRLSEWKLERDQAWQTLEQQLAQEKNNRLDALKKEVADEKEKAKARDAALAASHEAALARQATANAYRTTAIMLQRLASAELMERIVNLFEEDLNSLPDAQRSTLRDAVARLEQNALVEIVTSHPLAELQRQRLAQALTAAAAQKLQPAFKEQPDLIAGLRVSVGQCLLQANLADELSFFSEHDSHA